MRDYKTPWSRNFLPVEECDAHFGRFIGGALSLVILMLIIAVSASSCTDAVIKTSENQEKFYGSTIEQSYSRPAAYRTASPTSEQMDALHALMQVDTVAR